MQDCVAHVIWVSKSCMSVLLADDTNMFFDGNYLRMMINVINEELAEIYECLYGNKLSMHVQETHCGTPL